MTEERISDERLADLWWFLDINTKQDIVRADTFADCRGALRELQQARATIASQQAEVQRLIQENDLHMRMLNTQAVERQALAQRVADSDLAFAHANELVGKYMADAEAATQRVTVLEKALGDAEKEFRAIAKAYEHECPETEQRAWAAANTIHAALTPASPGTEAQR